MYVSIVENVFRTYPPAIGKPRALTETRTHLLQKHDTSPLIPAHCPYPFLLTSVRRSPSPSGTLHEVTPDLLQIRVSYRAAIMQTNSAARCVAAPFVATRSFVKPILLQSTKLPFRQRIALRSPSLVGRIPLPIGVFECRPCCSQCVPK